MGWKTINGRRYYYRVLRVGGRVVTEYAPVSIADLAAKLDGYETERREMAREAWRALREEQTSHDEVLDLICSDIRHLADADLVRRGCRFHKWQWRALKGKLQATKP